MLYEKRVRQGGKVEFGGRLYEHTALLDFVGKLVHVQRDHSIGGADCIVFTLANEHLCNAHNKRRWAKMTNPSSRE